MKIGDIVYLKSGSRPMTVVTLGGDGRHECAWDGGSATYPEASLTLDDPVPSLTQERAKKMAQEAINNPVPKAEAVIN